MNRMASNGLASQIQTPISKRDRLPCFSVLALLRVLHLKTSWKCDILGENCCKPTMCDASAPPSCMSAQSLL